MLVFLSFKVYLSHVLTHINTLIAYCFALDLYAIFKKVNGHLHWAYIELAYTKARKTNFAFLVIQLPVSNYFIIHN